MSQRQCDKPHLGLRLAGGKSHLTGAFLTYVSGKPADQDSPEPALGTDL